MGPGSSIYSVVSRAADSVRSACHRLRRTRCFSAQDSRRVSQGVAGFGRPTKRPNSSALRRFPERRVGSAPCALAFCSSAGRTRAVFVVGILPRLALVRDGMLAVSIGRSRFRRFLHLERSSTPAPPFWQRAGELEGMAYCSLRRGPDGAVGGTVASRVVSLTSEKVPTNWPAKMSHYGECDIDRKRTEQTQVLNSLAAEHMTLDQAAELMGVTPRHARRILAVYRECGAKALGHGHRGRPPANATPETVVADVVRLARTRYSGVNHTHLSELLAEREGIHIGRTTLRRVLLGAGLSSTRQRRPPKHRVRRQRMPREGMLIQMDGSYHPWLGDLASPFTLLIAVDDATGRTNCRLSPPK